MGPHQTQGGTCSQVLNSLRNIIPEAEHLESEQSNNEQILDEENEFDEARETWKVGRMLGLSTDREEDVIQAIFKERKEWKKRKRKKSTKKGKETCKKKKDQGYLGESHSVK